MYNYKRHSKVFKTWMIIVEVVYFIISIIAGFIIKADRETFNWSLALLIWASNAPLLAILYSIYSLLDNQEIQTDILYKILEQKQDSNVSDSSVLNNIKSIEQNISDSFWTCPKCGDKNKQSTVQCACGYFKSKTTIPQKTLAHTCSKCKKTFTVKYTPTTNSGKIPVLSVICPHCRNNETIK